MVLGCSLYDRSLGDEDSSYNGVRFAVIGVVGQLDLQRYHVEAHEPFQSSPPQWKPNALYLVNYSSGKHAVPYL